MTLDLESDCALSYRTKELRLEEVLLRDIANAVGTPVYCYSTAVLEANYRALRDAFTGITPRICYAVKANSNLAILRTLALLGAGADVVSEGELRRALAAGVPGSRIVYSGVGKKRQEIEFALQSRISQFNVESEAELESIAEIASSIGEQAPVALRVNPDIDAGTIEKIATGTQQTKFGIPKSRASHLYRQIIEHPALDAQGLSMHIGSQITELEPFTIAFQQLAELAIKLGNSGLPVPRLDFGGGLGVVYDRETIPTFVEYAQALEQAVVNLDCEVTIEPGRSLVANAGLLLSEVILTKRQESRSFVVLDAAINDLMRPGLYEAYHKIVPVRLPTESDPTRPVDFVGPVCESSDTFCRDEHAHSMRAGELVAFLTAGAYGAVMASTYNSRPLVPEVQVHEDKFELIRHRETYDEMLARDRIPNWVYPKAE